jgi:hypothetical protein
VVLECFVTGDIHVAGVPLISECRNGVHAPVEEDAKLGVAKPVRCTVLRERVPCGMEGDVGISWRGFGANFRYLALDVGYRILRRCNLIAEYRREKGEENGRRKRFHRDTIADGGVVL